MVGAAISVTVGSGAFVSTTGSLLSVVDATTVVVAFSDFAGFAFGFWVFATGVFDVVAFVDRVLRRVVFVGLEGPES
jgi:hypothetical protein